MFEYFIFVNGFCALEAIENGFQDGFSFEHAIFLFLAKVYVYVYSVFLELQ